MFNENLKNQFLSQISSVQQRVIVASFFEQTSGFERQNQKDLYSFDRQQIIDLIKSKQYTSYNTCVAVYKRIKLYCLWCKEHGFADSCNAILEITPTDFLDQSAFSKLPKDDVALLDYLNNTFSVYEGMPTETRIKHLMYRFYYWCAFCGVHESKFQTITKSNFNMQTYTISLESAEFEMPNAAIPDIENVLCFARSNTPILYTLGDTITMRRFSERITRAVARQNAQRLFYRDAYKAGQFFRIYKAEKLGFTPDALIYDLSRTMTVSEYTGYGNENAVKASEIAKKNKAHKALLCEYDLWKTTYSL